MTPECTGFTVEEIKALTKLNANRLHVCNSCTDKKGSGKLSQAPSTKMDRKPDDLNLIVETLNRARGKCSTQAQMTMECVLE